MTETSSSAMLVVRSMHFKPGYAHGLRAPALAIQINIPDVPVAAYEHLWERLQAVTALWGEFEHLDAELTQQALARSQFANPLAKWLMSACIWLQSLGTVPITSHGSSGQRADGQELAIVIPTQNPAVPNLRELLAAVVDMTNQALTSPTPIEPDFSEIRKLCSKLQAALRQFPPNTGYLLCAASRMNIPISYHIGQYYAFGQGRRHVLLNSSMPGNESCFGSTVAKNKVMTNTLLRQMGLPVPEQVAARTLEDAIAQAKRIGYPVVIKPADLDGGNGVFPFLQDEKALTEAWELCRRKTENIILEKHVLGLDYRLLVAKGELIAAIERGPAQVVGDGQQTIAQLLASENERRKAPAGQVALLNPLPNDAEAMAVLGAQGLGMTDVPAPGQIARLRMAPNHAQGGTVRWCLEQVHPDNARLALTIAEIVRLDVAGIDLICPDISQPWWSADAAICEVNHQPSMGRPTPHGIFERLLNTLLPDGATIPQIAIVGEPDVVAARIAELVDRLSSPQYRISSVRPDGVYLDNERITKGNVLYQRHRIAIHHPNAAATLIGISAPAELNLGLACAKLDFVVPASPASAQFAKTLAHAYHGQVAALGDLVIR